MLDVIAALGFACYVLLAVGVFATRRQRDGDAAARAARDLFIAFAVAIGLFAGVAQRDLWPFSNYPFAADVVRDRYAVSLVRGVDDRGEEREIDVRAWQPMAWDELSPWLMLRFPGLSLEHKRQAAADLLGRAEQTRRRAAAGESIDRLDRWLGPFAAPFFVLHPEIWGDRHAVPARPFVALRIYRESRALAAPERRERELVFEQVGQ